MPGANIPPRRHTPDCSEFLGLKGTLRFPGLATGNFLRSNRIRRSCKAIRQSPQFLGQKGIDTAGSTLATENTFVEQKLSRCHRVF